jgi:hypothetical protein
MEQSSKSAFTNDFQKDFNAGRHRPG